MREVGKGRVITCVLGSDSLGSHETRSVLVGFDQRVYVLFEECTLTLVASPMVSTWPWKHGVLDQHSLSGATPSQGGVPMTLVGDTDVPTTFPGARAPRCKQYLLH